MASSKCPACTSHSFELRELVPSGSKYKLYSIQCSSCGAVVGVLEYTNTEYLINQLSSQIKEVQSGLEVINQNLSTVIRAVNK